MSPLPKCIPGKRLKSWHRKVPKELRPSLIAFAREMAKSTTSDRRAVIHAWRGGYLHPKAVA